MLTHLSVNSKTFPSGIVTSTLVKSNAHHSTFELANEPAKRQRWIAHVSASSRLISDQDLVLHIKPSAVKTAFDIIERVLFAKTCKSIHTDESFTLHQVRMLKQMAMFSGTEIVFISDKNDFNHLHANDLEKA